MHYYKRNLGDYAKKAGRLSMLEHGSYTLLIDACYDREQFPTLDEAIDWCWARTEAEIEAVKFVLSKFFTLDGGVYVQKRIQEELAEYHAKAEKNKEIATERENKRKEKARTVHEPLPQEHEAPPNHKPLTNNQEPITNDKHTEQKPCVSNPVDQSFEIPFAAVVCQAMRKLGMADVNPGHPKLLKLIEQGASIAEFEHVAAKSIASSKGFAYALGMLAKLREEAAAMPAGSALVAVKVGAAEPAWRREQRERTEKAVPGIAARSVGEFQKTDLQTFDVEAKNVVAIALGR
jgi:uncharacterized protein YdaU (DUF1376 family)